MPANFFVTVRPSLFDVKTWYPLLCIKFFDTPNFLKHWRDAHEMFWHCETKTFRLKIVILPPPFPPFLSIIFFSIPDFFWYTDQRGSPTKFFSTETKKISTKLWDKSLKHKIFRYPKLVTHWRFPLRNFSGTVRQTFFDGKSWYSLLPSPLLSICFFGTRNFLKQRRVPLRSIIGTVRQQYFL